jgi:hypothetical protein
MSLMTMNEADKIAATPAATGDAPLLRPLVLRPLGDADAAVCTDGFCAVPPAGTSTGADQ